MEFGISDCCSLRKTSLSRHLGSNGCCSWYCFACIIISISSHHRKFTFHFCVHNIKKGIRLYQTWRRSCSSEMRIFCAQKFCKYFPTISEINSNDFDCGWSDFSQNSFNQRWINTQWMITRQFRRWIHIRPGYIRGKLTKPKKSTETHRLYDKQ